MPDIDLLNFKHALSWLRERQFFRVHEDLFRVQVFIKWTAKKVCGVLTDIKKVR